MNDTIDALVIGGGAYGLAIARHLARTNGDRVVVVEREPALLTGASFANQARVHRGYHYPRSFLTGARSSQRYRRFVAEYADCVVADVEAFYAIARAFSKVTARQFVEFCGRIDAPIELAPREVLDLFRSDMVEAVFRVEEAAFDPGKLAQRLMADAADAGVEIRLSTNAVSLARGGAGWSIGLEGAGGGTYTVHSSSVYNCTYDRLNDLLISAGEAPVPLKHELAELVLVEPPHELVGRAVTVMCGPFFSITPFPAENKHVLSHVRYTPHRTWMTGTRGALVGQQLLRDCESTPRSNAVNMLADARRFLPCMADARPERSLWAVKTVLPRNEIDDGRPILLHRTSGAPGLVSVMGSKIDNIYDVLDVLSPDPAPAGADA